MTKEFVMFSALVLLYVSVVIGTFVKLKYYKVERDSIFLAFILPIALVIIAHFSAMEYIKSLEKERKKLFSFYDKVMLMLKLTRINIECFPALVGIAASILKKVEINNLLKNKSAKKRQAKRSWKEKSHRLYDDSDNIGLAC